MKMEKIFEQTGVVMETYRLQSLVWGNRTIRALEERKAGYPFVRQLRYAARVELEALMDAFALEPAWRVHRLGTDEAVIDGDGLYVFVYGTRKAEYCSFLFYIYATSVARVEAVKEQLLAKAGSTLVTEPMFSIDWHFKTGNGLDNASIEEVSDGPLLDAAYPEVPGGVARFIEAYLDSPESVLVLQGPPGTGKTRLIRAILGAMSRRKGEPACALYTGDMRALETDELFVKFITGAHDAFVVEDADHMLKPRVDGNEHLHRFLTVADGVVRSQGRKIVFSTNLPNVGDLDEALIRPGRCYARLNIRALTGVEAKYLAEKLAAGDAEKVGRLQAAFDGQKRSHSLAEVYQAMR
jgi:hypothetical protein